MAGSKKKEPSRSFLREEPLKKTMAQEADKHQCYQRSVQDPKKEVKNLRNIYLEHSTVPNKQPMILREDFCGTAILCESWIKMGVERIAYGVDIDQSVIEYGKKQFSVDTDRIILIVANVLDVETPKVDILVALNYGLCYFKQRCILIKYLYKAKESLIENGIFICDIFGGKRSYQEKSQNCRDHGDFEYIFEQKGFNVLTNQIDCRIHFKFKDKSWLKDVFKYDFRLWSVAELREAFLEVGFKNVYVWLSETHMDGGLQDDYIRVDDKVNPMESFNAYIVGTLH